MDRRPRRHKLEDSPTPCAERSSNSEINALYHAYLTSGLDVPLNQIVHFLCRKSLPKCDKMSPLILFSSSRRAGYWSQSELGALRQWFEGIPNGPHWDVARKIVDIQQHQAFQTHRLQSARVKLAMFDFILCSVIPCLDLCSLLPG